MAAVMEQAAETDDKIAFSEQELISKLTTENKVSMKCWLLKEASALICNISSIFILHTSSKIVKVSDMTTYSKPSYACRNASTVWLVTLYSGDSGPEIMTAVWFCS